jgi:hypothetical protein
MTGRELARLRRADRISRATLACRTRWTTERLRKIESKDYVADSTARHFLAGLDSAHKFRLATEARKLAAKSRREACSNRHCCLTPAERGN